MDEERKEMKSLYAMAAYYREAEEEIAWTYFNSAARDSGSDALWLRRQCFKEIWGSGVGDPQEGLCPGLISEVGRLYSGLDSGVDRSALLNVIDVLRAEFFHYCLFADLYEELVGEALLPAALEGWAADEALATERLEIRTRFGAVGDAAVRFTEGGSGSLYLAGIRLAGRGGFDEKISDACQKVYDDEFDHMRSGATQLEQMAAAGDFSGELVDLVRRVMVLRLQMRNEQLGHPVSAEYLREIEAGEGKAQNATS